MDQQAGRLSVIFQLPASSYPADNEVFAKSGEEESAKALLSVLALMQSGAIHLLSH